MNTEDALFVGYKFKFSLCRIVDDLLVASNFKVSADIDIIDDGLVELAMRKIEYWFDSVVSSSIAVSASNRAGLSMLLDEHNTPRLMNPLMICPMEPSDSNLCVLFQAKLQALAENAFSLESFEIESDNAAGLTFNYMGNAEESLPSMDEWITGPTWFEKPWWSRDDASIFDTIAAEGSDLTKIPSWAYDLTAIVQQDMIPQEAILLKADFKPQIIED